MVVPAPNSIGLLTEHAIQEFGYSSALDIYDFDYKMGPPSSSTLTTSNPVLLSAISMVILVAYLLSTALSPHSRQEQSLPLHNTNKISFQATREQVLDIEAQLLPELSHSQSSTPSASPSMGKQFLSEFSVHSLSDHRVKQS